MKLGNYCILCTDQKMLAKQLYESLSDIIKRWKPFYEQEKQ